MPANELVGCLSEHHWRQLFLGLKTSISEAKQDPDYRQAQEKWQEERGAENKSQIVNKRKAHLIGADAPKP